MSNDFDIFDHEFSDAHDSDLELDESSGVALEFYCDGYPKFNKEDVVAMAKHFMLKAEDLN